jgi:hypothetical protein
MSEFATRGTLERPACYKLSRQEMGCHLPMDNLRVELTAIRFYLLPYHHLELAEFQSAHKGDLIALSFVNHKVRIEGQGLRDLALAFQERAVVWVKPFLDEYVSVWESAPGLIHSIEFE